MVSLRTGFTSIDVSHNTLMSQYYAYESMILATAAQESMTSAMESNGADEGSSEASEEKEKNGISIAVKKVMNTIKGLIKTAGDKLRDFGKFILEKITNFGPRVPFVGKKAYEAVRKYLDDCRVAIAKVISGKEDSKKILEAIGNRWTAVKESTKTTAANATTLKASDAKGIAKEVVGKIGGAIKFLATSIGKIGTGGVKLAAKGSVGAVSEAFHIALSILRYMKTAAAYLFTGNGPLKPEKDTSFSDNDAASQDSWMEAFNEDESFNFATESEFGFDFDDEMNLGFESLFI